MYHIIFITAFCTVAVIVTVTLTAAAVRARKALAERRVDEIRWHMDFEAMPARDRQCRHVLTGEFKSRECPHAFDCRQCETHPKLLARHPLNGPAEEEVFGMYYPSDRLYHRGHTWARPESDGTVTIGLDELGRRVLGPPDATALPAPGTLLRANGPAWRMWKRNAEVRVLSPVDGEVVETGGAGEDWLVRVKPGPGGFDLRHLLVPCEMQGWILRELERLQLALATEGMPTLADGGVPVEDIGHDCPQADWDAVCGEMFLQG